MDWGPVLGVSLTAALVACGLFTLLLVGGGLVARDAGLHNYPQAIQDRYGPKSRRGQRVTVVLAGLMGLLFTAVPLVAMLQLRDRLGVDLGFWPGFVLGVTVFAVLSVYDLVVVDWWLFCTVQPRLFVLPGTEGMPEYRDIAFHWKVLVPRPVPWPLLLIPGYGALVGGLTVVAEFLW